GLTKTSTALPRLALPCYLYCLRLRRLVLIFVNPLYPPYIAGRDFNLPLSVNGKTACRDTHPAARILKETP
ncbi:hypothetical protein, partial [Neisseria meningitidis]|uniref:hypothetical protein n=1 Tax=Neisseria meningitidis TaxID=487 RepID=UPI001C59168D